jgi:REP element-mobilizing transposase RayT
MRTDNRSDCLTGQNIKSSTAFIRKLETIVTNDDKNKFKILLIDNELEDIKYEISNIEVTENNVDLLWSLYENNKKIEIAVVYEKDYIIMNFLGLFVGLVESDENTYKSIDIILNEE